MGTGQQRTRAIRRNRHSATSPKTRPRRWNCDRTNAVRMKDYYQTIERFSPISIFVFRFYYKVLYPFFANAILYPFFANAIPLENTGKLFQIFENQICILLYIDLQLQTFLTKNKLFASILRLHTYILTGRRL